MAESETQALGCWLSVAAVLMPATGVAKKFHWESTSISCKLFFPSVGDGTQGLGHARSAHSTTELHPNPVPTGGSLGMVSEAEIWAQQKTELG